MDKMEYKTKIQEMKALVSDKKFADALSVADGVNWRKVQNINDLVIGSETYEAAGKNEEARELLLLAHERSPIGRTIIYKLCTISIKLGEMEDAQAYYNDYVQIAPHDSMKYVLKYNINVAKGADNQTLIKILEQLKEHDFLEEWAYELAYLYHKTSQFEKCIDLCDEIVLWFGDGPIVERALELKMLYQPLDKGQEDTYRHMQQKKDGITEITANETLMSGEIIPHTITIPSVQMQPDKFSTINLQAEIKKNIEEIMKATEKGEVSENIDAIKTLVEEIPYLQMPVEEEKVIEEEEEKFSVNETFNAYLEEGFDGQISLKLPDENSTEETQIEGQMTIEDVLAEWERTKRAAEAAMEEAKKKELEGARAKALREANQVLSRLEDAMAKTDDSFSIPKIDLEGAQVGSMDIPVVKPAEPIVPATVINDPIVSKDQVSEATTNWQPQELEENDDVDYKEASQLIADVNKMLQQEIDRLTDDEPEPAKIQEPEATNFEVTIELPEVSTVEPKLEEPASEEIFEEEVVLPEIILPEVLFEETAEPEPMKAPEPMVVPEPIIEPEVKQVSPAVDEQIRMEVPAQKEDEVVLPEIQIPMEDLLGETPVKEEIPDDLPVISDVVFEPEEVAELVDEKVLTNAIKDEVPKFKLSEEDLANFAYFLPIKGMKGNITRLVAGAMHHVQNPKSKGGHIIIVGDPGSGKTQMATNVISTLKNNTGKPEGGIGKISGENLNKKDIQKLFAKIQGGCLIVESAGNITKETAATMSLLMEHDHSGTIIVFEDTQKGIDKVFRYDSSLANRFTEKIVIPTLTIDELVSFGRAYAREEGYSIDEMGVLALYNSINGLDRLNHATTIKEVAEIVDGAIAHCSKGGFFSKPKVDKEGFYIIKEKDFEG